MNKHTNSRTAKQDNRLTYTMWYETVIKSVNVKACVNTFFNLPSEKLGGSKKIFQFWQFDFLVLANFNLFKRESLHESLVNLISLKLYQTNVNFVN